VFSQILLELKSGDLCIPGSNRFSDYREQLVSLEEYAREITRYGEQAGIPIEGQTFTAQLQAQLEAAAQRADDGFPTNTYVRLEHGEPVLTRLRRQPDPAGLRRLEQRLKERMSPVEILDALSDTEHWLHWTQHFGPISGYEAKLEQPRERYLMTAFCYGCTLGPTQTARSIKGLDRKQVAFVNQRHVTEETLNEAIVTVINAYHRFPPSCAARPPIAGRTSSTSPSEHWAVWCGPFSCCATCRRSTCAGRSRPLRTRVRRSTSSRSGCRLVAMGSSRRTSVTSSAR
jgi:hypothetical protein